MSDIRFAGLDLNLVKSEYIPEDFVILHDTKNHLYTVVNTHNGEIFQLPSRMKFTWADVFNRRIGAKWPPTL